MNRTSGTAVLAALSIATLSGCGVGEAKVEDIADQAAAAPLPVKIVYAETADIYATYDVTTTILADSDAPVLARVSGEVVEILIEEGEQVAKGQVLARLDGERLRLEMLQAKAILDQATKEYERLTSLHERGLVSASSFDGLRFDRDAQQASYQLTQLAYDYTKIRAPISGIISSRDITVGQHVVVSDTVFHVTDTSGLVAYLHIPQTELDKFFPGHMAELRVDALPEKRFEATIARISPTIDARNGTFRATAYINNAAGDLAPGMFGRFSIAYDRHPEALVIPVRALVEEDGVFVVYVMEDGAAVRRVVEIGIRSKDKVEVLGGIRSNEAIVVSGQLALRDGTPVLASNTTTENLSG